MDHARKSHNLGLFARMGGPFQRMFFLLEIFGDELDPEVVSSLLGSAATKCYKKGDVRPRGSQYYKCGAWILDSGEILIGESRSGEEGLKTWVDAIPGDKAAWAELRAQYDVHVRIVGYTDQMNADFTIPPEVLGRLSELGLPLTMDPYLSLDDG